jgi:hypothetical protein
LKAGRLKGSSPLLTTMTVVRRWQEASQGTSLGKSRAGRGLDRPLANDLIHREPRLPQPLKAHDLWPTLGRRVHCAVQGQTFVIKESLAQDSEPRRRMRRRHDWRLGSSVKYRAWQACLQRGHLPLSGLSPRSMSRQDLASRRIVGGDRGGPLSFFKRRRALNLHLSGCLPHLGVPTAPRPSPAKPACHRP